MFIVENIPPRHVRVKYQLDSEHFTMCVFVMRISGNKVISNPELDVEDRWFPDRTSIERRRQKTNPQHSCSNRSSFGRIRIVHSSKRSSRLHPNWTYGEYAISSTNDVRTNISSLNYKWYSIKARTELMIMLMLKNIKERSRKESV